MVVAQVVFVVEAVSAVVVAHLAVDPAVHLPKDVMPLTARTSRTTRKATTATVGSIRCLDILASKTTEPKHSTAGKLPSARSTMTCVPIVSVAKSSQPVTVLKTQSHVNSVRRQCSRQLRGKQGSKFSRMFDSGSRSLSVASIILSKHLNSALASSKSSTSFMFTNAHPPNQVRVWY